MKKKSKFFSALFSLIPGAGQMYLGLMKRGTLLMGLFALDIMIAIMLRFEYLLVAAPIIWFYAFFDALNLRSMDPEELAKVDDSFPPLPESFGTGKLSDLIGRRHMLGGIALIVIGLWLVVNTLLGPFWEYIYRLSPILYSFLSDLPALVVPVLIILLGIRLIRGGKRPKPEGQEDYKEFAQHE